jgi:hypothetical protein
MRGRGEKPMSNNLEKEMERWKAQYEQFKTQCREALELVRQGKVESDVDEVAECISHVYDGDRCAAALLDLARENPRIINPDAEPLTLEVASKILDYVNYRRREELEPTTTWGAAALFERINDPAASKLRERVAGDLVAYHNDGYTLKRAIGPHRAGDRILHYDVAEGGGQVRIWDLKGQEEAFDFPTD